MQYGHWKITEKGVWTGTVIEDATTLFTGGNQWWFLFDGTSSGTGKFTPMGTVSSLWYKFQWQEALNTFDLATFRAAQPSHSHVYAELNYPDGGMQFLGYRAGAPKAHGPFAQIDPGHRHLLRERHQGADFDAGQIVTLGDSSVSTECWFLNQSWVGPGVNATTTEFRLTVDDPPNGKLMDALVDLQDGPLWNVNAICQTQV